MVSSLADFAEKINPKTLAEASRAGFQQATRVHGSLLAAAEKRVLLWIAERMPAWVNSDHLTVIGFAAQIATGICYALAAWDRRLLLAAIVCLAVNWFGDSLDGTLARVRRQQRPRYGFYVDHIIDSIGAAAMMGGLAFSGYMHPVSYTHLDVYKRQHQFSLLIIGFPSRIHLGISLRQSPKPQHFSSQTTCVHRHRHHPAHCDNVAAESTGSSPRSYRGGPRGLPKASFSGSLKI